MATEVIHEHGHDSTSGGSGLLIGIVVLVLAIIALFYFFGNGFLAQTQNPSVQVPEQVDVNVNQP